MEKLFTAGIDFQVWLQLLNKPGLLNLTMVVSFAERQNVKRVLFDVLTSCFTSELWVMDRTLTPNERP